VAKLWFGYSFVSKGSCAGGLVFGIVVLNWLNL
jgi:hypothetical protein